MPRNPVLAVCYALGVAAALWLPFLRSAPNRLVSGESVYLSALLQGPAWSLAPLALALALAAFLPERRLVNWAIVLAGSLLMAGLLWLAGHHAQQVAQAQSPIARTALGAGFWSLMALLWLACADALERLGVGALQRSAVLVLIAVPLAGLIALGQCDQLSIMKEYANRDDVFAAAVLRHIQIVLLATVPTLLVGLPMAWAAYHHQKIYNAIFPVLNIIQTIPSIALFGLFMAPLAWLAAAYPALRHAGISGVGLAPAVLALVLYSLLPVTRSAVAGLEQVPHAVKTAAKGMGMGALQIFWRVEVPLVLPVLLLGLRTAVVQTIGLAAVTALVGAGGLGTIMFEGLFSSAHELVLLGVLPIVVLAVIANSLFNSLISLLKGPAP